MEDFLERCTVKGLEFDAGLRNIFVLIYTDLTVINFHCVKRKKTTCLNVTTVTIYDRKFNIYNRGTDTDDMVG